MNFSHCDHDEKYLTLHDCIAERAYFENGKLGFEFDDGFWVSPDHPESNSSDLVRTDHSKVEYTLEDGEDYDVTVYVFKKSFSKKAIRAEWTLQELVYKINTGKCKLEFLYQYIDYNSRIIECELKFEAEALLLLYDVICPCGIFFPYICGFGSLSCNVLLAV